MRTEAERTSDKEFNVTRKHTDHLALPHRVGPLRGNNSHRHSINQLDLCLSDHQNAGQNYDNSSVNTNVFSTARSCESLYNQINIPEKASRREIKIHQFLDFMSVKQINVKEYIESLSKIESPNVRKLFQE